MNGCKNILPAYPLLSLLIWLAISSAGHGQEALNLPPAKVGVAYEYRMQTEGGLPPLRWKVVDGDLPAGIELPAAGVLTGTPNSAQSQPFVFSAEVEDSERPPQRSVQRLSLIVVPSPLRIILRNPSPNPVPAASAVTSNPELPSKRESQVGHEELQVSQISYPPPRSAHWILPLQASEGSTTAQASSPNDVQHGQGGTKPTPRNPLDPATFIRIFEDTKAGSHLNRYEPIQKGSKNALQFAVDLESSILIAPDGEKMGDDPALNKLYVTAKLASGDTSKDLVVTGYSVIGQDKSTMAAQSGTAFQSAANVEAMVFNMAYTVGDILRYVYLPAQQAVPNAQETFPDWLKAHQEIEFQSEQVRNVDTTISRAVQSDNPFSSPELQRVRERFRLYQPEIQAISDFFLQPDNLAIVERVGVEVFWIDRNSLQAIAQQYKNNIQIAFDSKSTASAQAQALQDVLERTKLVYRDFGEFRRDIRQQLAALESQTLTDEQWNARFEEAILSYSDRKRKQAFAQLKSHLATGSISLPDYQAKDGDRLTITVESLPADSTSGGVPVVFQITIKKYGAKIQWSPSLLFIRRLRVTDAEATPPTGSTAAPINRVNFAPSPGMTFGVAYFKRGQRGGDKFLRALGPGLGMNVTFMNFNDPSFDLATSKFVNTTGTNVQVGAGAIGSLFDNKIQFAYGWNLNVEHRRNYFGVGFGFIEIGKELTKYIGK